MGACLCRICIGLIWLTAAGASHADGAQLYASLCQNCHGEAGQGAGPGIPEGAIRPRPFAANAFKFDTDADWETGTDADLANVIRQGPSTYGGSALMPPWPTLSDEDVAALVGHIRALQEP